MEDLPTTPPVVDTPASRIPASEMDTGDWDGTERRRVDPLKVAIESAVNKVSQPHNGTDLRETRDLLFKIAVAALLFLLLLGQWIVVGNQGEVKTKIDRYEENQKPFRDSITCFVTEIFTGPDAQTRSDILTKCGFVRAPGRD
jgi:hypothetical protein